MGWNYLLVNDRIGNFAICMVGIWGIGFGISIWKSKRKERVFLDICQSGKTCRMDFKASARINGKI